MSNGSTQFGAAARLYAENAAVVDEMWRAFLSDIGMFFDSLREQIQAKLPNCQIDEEASKAARSWWIKDQDVKDSDEVPYIWFKTQEPEIIVPGLLHLNVYFDGTDEITRKRLAAVPTQLRLPSHCRVQDKPGVLTLVITYGNGDPVSLAADPIRDLLIAIREADRKKP